MASFKIDPADVDAVEFEIPSAAGDGTVTIAVPHLDSIHPKSLKKATEAMEKEDISPEAPESTRIVLRVLTEGKADIRKAIDNLTFRQLVQIQQHWNKETDTASEKVLGFTSNSENGED